jgi:hypothetical protein
MSTDTPSVKAGPTECSPKYTTSMLLVSNYRLHESAPANAEIGVVLLEIGLWQPAITLGKNHFCTARDAFVIQAQLSKQAQRRLGDKMGEKYQNVVILCLTGEFGVDADDDLKPQQAFRTQVVDVLDRIAKAV